MNSRVIKQATDFGRVAVFMGGAAAEPARVLAAPPRPGARAPDIVSRHTT